MLFEYKRNEKTMQELVVAEELLNNEGQVDLKEKNNDSWMKELKYMCQKNKDS